MLAFNKQEISREDLYLQTKNLISEYESEIPILDILAGKYNEVGQAIINARKQELSKEKNTEEEILLSYERQLLDQKVETGISEGVGIEEGKETLTVIIIIYLLSIHFFYFLQFYSIHK